MTHTQGRLTVNNDGYGEECHPPEPGKRWLTVADSEGNEIAVVVNRHGEPTAEQWANAAELVRRWNTFEPGGAAEQAIEALRSDGCGCFRGMDALAALTEGVS